MNEQVTSLESVEVQAEETVKDNKSSETDSEITDVREPNLSFTDSFIIFKIIGWNWIFIALGCVGSIGMACIPLSFQFILGDLVNVFQSSNGTVPTTSQMNDSVSEIAIKFAFIAVGSFVSTCLNQFFLTIAKERIGNALRTSYFNALTKQEMGYFDIKKSGSLTVALSEDVLKIQEAYTQKMAVLVQNLVQFILGIVLSFVSSWQMSLVMISTSPLLVIGMIIVSRVLEVFNKKITKCLEKSASISNEVISSFRTVKSMGCETKERDRYAACLRKVVKLSMVNGSIQGLVFSFFNFTSWGTIALSFWFGGGLVAKGVLSVGNMMKVFGLMLFGVIGLSTAGTVVPDIAKAHTSQNTILKVLKRVPTIPSSGGKVPQEEFNWSIELKNVSFSYPSRPKDRVLSDFSINIKQGSSVALVGPSGSGKSTIASLLERFYDPDQGEVLIGGYNVKDIDPQWLHNNIGIVTQEPVLFATSIRENIAYAVGIENTTQEQVEMAAKVANCHNFIIDLPSGYSTILGERGVSLSGGQKQRVAIARAILQNPKILLLDEATSALDTESEALVQMAIDNLMKGRTCISIAHRLSTIQNCDSIYVLVKGELKEFGSHNELVNIENGVYKKLAEKQMVFGKYDN